MAPRKAAASGTRDYEVGYGKPPKATQFKPGCSGNKKGRPPGSLSLEEEARCLLDETVSVQGGTGKITRRRMMVRALYAKAMQGHVNAFLALMKLEGAAEEIRGSSAPTYSVEGMKEQLAFLEDLKAEFLTADKGEIGGKVS